MTLQEPGEEVREAIIVQGSGDVDMFTTLMFSTHFDKVRSEDEIVHACLNTAREFRHIPNVDPLMTPKVREDHARMNMAMALVEQRINKVLMILLKQRTFKQIPINQ